jgi:hypothetical protein
MALPYWYEKGREYAFEVLDGLENAGAFKPAEAMEAWFLFHQGSGWIAEIDDERVAKEVEDFMRWALTVRSAQRQFAQGYREAMRETRPARKAAAHQEAR